MLSHFSGGKLFVALWTVACQAPLSMGFFKQEYAMPFSKYCSGKEPTRLLLLLLLLLLSHFSHIRLCTTPWTAAYQAPRSMEFSRQEYWSG